MRHMEICKMNAILNEENVGEAITEEITIVYYVTIDELTDAATGIVLETYGVGVTIVESGESEVIPNVTFSKTGILSLINLLSHHLVTPVTLTDVVYDWLCAD